MEQEQSISARDNILSSIKEFLEESLVYECLPQNSQVIVIDKIFSCFDTFKVFVNNDCVDCISWNSEISFFDRIITYTDICEIVIGFLLNIIENKNNREYFEDRRGKNSFFEEEAEFVFQVKDIKGNPTKLDYNEKTQRMDIETEEKGKEQINIPKYIPEYKEKLIKDLKLINLKCWYLKSSIELFKQTEIISIDLEKKLVDACEKMKVDNLHRIIILDREKNLVVGTLTHRDILLFIIRNFKGKNADYFKTPLAKLGIIGYLEKPFTILKTTPLFIAFRLMLKKKLSSIPIVNEKDQYIGLINKSDMFFIIRDELYELLFNTSEEFLNFLNREKKKYKATKLECCQFYTPNESIQEIVEKLLFSNGNRIFYLDEQTKKIVGLITLTDLFKFYLEMK